jgi:hypothetical protein
MDIFITITMSFIALYLCLFLTIFSFVFILGIYTEIVQPILRLIKKLHHG